MELIFLGGMLVNPEHIQLIKDVSGKMMEVVDGDFASSAHYTVFLTGGIQVEIDYNELRVLCKFYLDREFTSEVNPLTVA